ncbi:hypothetical protein ABBQ32_010162 [Trebouxia sp. C0010 RCD-2024]
MAKYCTSGALADGWGGQYTLGGVVLHQGSSGDAGHYTFLQKQPDSNIWVLFNDAKTPKARTPNQVLGFRQLVCGFVYHRTPPPRAQAQLVDAAGKTRPPPLYESIPGLCQSEGPASSEVPAVVTALTTLPALGTAKHMLSQQQQADLSERQAAITAQRKAAAELQLHQLARQAQADKVLRRSKKEEERQAEQDLVEGAKQRQQAAQARKVQRLAREQAAHEQQRKAAQAAATQDAARYRAGAESQPTELPSSLQAAPLSKKERAQARLATKQIAKTQEKAEEAASAAAARQLVDAAAQQQQEAEVAAAVKQEALAAQQQAEADAAASQYAATESAAAAEQAASQSHMAADQLLEADLAVFAELAANDAIAAAQQEINAEASAAEPCLEAAAAAIKQAAAQQQIEAEAAAAAATKQAAAHKQTEVEAAAAAAITHAAAQQPIEAEAAAAAAITLAAAHQHIEAACLLQTEVEAAANAEQADAEVAEGLEDPAGSLKGQGPDDADAAVRLKANLPGNAEKQAKQTVAGAANAAKDQLIKAAHANNQQAADNRACCTSSVSHKDWTWHTRVDDHREVLPCTTTKPRLDEPPPEAGAYGSNNCSDPAHMHSTTEPSEAGSPSEQLSHQPAEPLQSSTAQHGVSASQADVDSHEPVATCGSGHDSPCSDAGPGNGSSASSVTEQSAAATVRAEASNGIRGTLQDLQAED